MEGLEDYQDAGDDFWNFDSSEIYNNFQEPASDIYRDSYLNYKDKKLKARSSQYSEPFTLAEINSFRNKLFKKFIIDNYKIYPPMYPTGSFEFGKYKDKYLIDIFEDDVKYIDYLIHNTGAVFNLKNHYSFSIKCGLTVPSLLLNDIKHEYFEGFSNKQRKIFSGEEIIEVSDDYYDLYL